MYIMLCSVKGQLTFVYFDDIAIFSKAPEKHVKHVRQILMLLIDAVKYCGRRSAIS